MAAINYKSLAHAEKSSQWALWLAAFSILLTALGIFLQWRQTRLAEIQAIPEQINQIRAKQNALEFYKQNPTDQSSGLYFSKQFWKNGLLFRDSKNLQII